MTKFSLMSVWVMLLFEMLHRLNVFYVTLFRVVTMMKIGA